MIDEMACYHCRFFSPGQTGCPSFMQDQKITDFEKCKEGICRRHPPRHGNPIPKTNGDDLFCLAEWPKVMATDWCGEFESRTAHRNCNHHNCANCGKGKGDCE